MTDDDKPPVEKSGVTLVLDDREASWLSDHLEDFIAVQPVNTAPDAHRIVTKLHPARLLTPRRAGRR